MKAWAAIIRRYVHELLAWGFRAWPIWLSIFPLVLILCLPGTLEDRLRYGGLAFELLGVATVALGLSEKGRQFDRHISSFFMGWWASRPRFGKRSHVLGASVNLSGIVGMSAKLSIWHGTPPDSTVNVRVDALEKNLLNLRNEIDDTSKRLQEEERTRTEAIKAERLAREADRAHLATRLDQFAVGGLHIEWMGIGWLVVGLVLSNIPAEITKALHWLGRGT